MKRGMAGRPLCWSIVVTLLLVGLWPREPSRENRIEWRTPGPGLRFAAPSQAITERPLWTTTGAMTIELWLAPHRSRRPGNAEILSLVDAPGVHRLLVGQFQEGWILRGQRDNPAGDPKRDRYRDVASIESIRHIAVTVDGAGARLHANGRATGLVLPATRAQPGVAFGGRLLLGSSDSGWADWEGSLFALAVHRRVLTARELARHADFEFTSARANPPAFEAWGDRADLATLHLFEQQTGARAASRVPGAPALVMPHRLERPLRSTVLTGLSSPRREPLDVAINVLGFVPLGFVVAWRRRRGAAWWALLAGVGISLAIELAQIEIPGRDSSALDVLCNGIGTFAGGWLAVWGRRRARI